MKKLKRTLAFALVLLLLFSMSVFAEETPQDTNFRVFF